MKFIQLLRSSCAASAICAASITTGCGSPTTSAGQPSSAAKTAAPQGEVVAKVGDGAITVDEFKAKLAEQPPMTLSRMGTPAGKKEFLDNLTKFELLSQEATRRGIDKSPSVQNTIKRILVQELVNQYYQAKIEPTDDDLKGYFEKHKAEFMKPEARRVQQIFIAAADGTQPAQKEARTKAKAKAEQLLTKLKAADTKVAVAADPTAVLDPLPLFSDLAKQSSTDERTKAKGGDTGFVQKDSLGLEYSFPFATAAFTLTPQHRLSDVIETPKGYHIARLLGIQSPTTKDPADPTVKGVLRDHYVQDQRRERFEKFYDDLKKSTKIDVDDKVLASIEIPAPRQPGGGPHGMPPNMPGAPGMMNHPPMQPPPGAAAVMGRPPMPPPGAPHNPMKQPPVHLQANGANPAPAAQPK